MYTLHLSQIHCISQVILALISKLFVSSFKLSNHVLYPYRIQVCTNIVQISSRCGDVTDYLVSLDVVCSSFTLRSNMACAGLFGCLKARLPEQYGCSAGRL
jgi:hypothetical protein